MENLNEVLPKYKLTKNGKPVVGHEDYNDVMHDMSETVSQATKGDIIKVMENDKVIRVVEVGQEG